MDVVVTDCKPGLFLNTHPFSGVWAFFLTTTNSMYLYRPAQSSRHSDWVAGLQGQQRRPSRDHLQCQAILVLLRGSTTARM